MPVDVSSVACGPRGRVWGKGPLGAGREHSCPARVLVPPSPSGSSVSSPLWPIWRSFSWWEAVYLLPAGIGCAGAGLGGSLSGGMAEGCRAEGGSPPRAAPAAGLWVGWKGQAPGWCCCQAVRALDLRSRVARRGPQGPFGGHHGSLVFQEYLCKHAVPCLLGITRASGGTAAQGGVAPVQAFPRAPRTPRVPEELEGVRRRSFTTSAPSFPAACSPCARRAA